jgi:hypothetical protein
MTGSTSGHYNLRFQLSCASVGEQLQAIRFSHLIIQEVRREWLHRGLTVPQLRLLAEDGGSILEPFLLEWVTNMEMEEISAIQGRKQRALLNGMRFVPQLRKILTTFANDPDAQEANERGKFSRPISF